MTTPRALAWRRVAGGAIVGVLAFGTFTAPAIAGGRAHAVASPTIAGGRARAAATSTVAVKELYASVLLAEYFGSSKPNSREGVSYVCNHLTPAGRFAYTGRATRGCGSAFIKVFVVDQKALRLKEDAADWAAQAKLAASRLRVRFSAGGRRATLTDPDHEFSGTVLIRHGRRWRTVHRTTVVERGGRWLFSSSPPLPV